MPASRSLLHVSVLLAALSSAGFAAYALTPQAPAMSTLTVRIDERLAPERTPLSGIVTVTSPEGASTQHTFTGVAGTQSEITIDVHPGSALKLEVLGEGREHTQEGTIIGDLLTVITAGPSDTFGIATGNCAPRTVGGCISTPSR